MAKLTSFEVFRDELLANPAVRAGYDAMENEFAIAGALISARSEAGLSQSETAERMGVTMGVIARVESGRRVSLPMLRRYATAVGRTITIKIHPSGVANG